MLCVAYLVKAVMNEKISVSLTEPFSNFKDLNIGMVLMSVYILFDFGAFQGVFEIVNKLKLPYILALASLAYALYLVLNKKVEFSSLTTRSYLILCLFIIIYSQIITIDPLREKAFLTLFIQYISNYIIIVTCVKKPSQFIFLIDVWLFSILHSSYHAIAQGGKLYDSIWLRDENHISLVCAYAIPFAFFLFMTYRSKLKKIFYVICMIFFVTAVVVSVSRGGLVTMATMGFLCWLFVKNKFRTLLMLLLAIVLVIQFAPQRFFDEAKTLQQGTEEGTANERVYSWGLAVMMFMDYPIIGLGPGNYPEYFQEYDYEARFGEDAGRSAYAKRVAHSTPFEWLAEAGIIGGILFTILHISIYRNWKTVKKFKKSSKNNDDEDEDVKRQDMLYKVITHACAFTYLGFWVAAAFLSLLPYPFLWILIPFSEAWKNIVLKYIEQRSIVA